MGIAEGEIDFNPIQDKLYHGIGIWKNVIARTDVMLNKYFKNDDILFFDNIYFESEFQFLDK